MKTSARSTHLILSSLFAATLLGAAAGCGRNSADNPPPPAASNNSKDAGQFVDDTALTAKVKAVLAEDSAVKSSDISVTTNQGVVTLSGTVATSDQKSAAAKDAASVSGVKDVTNTLTTP